MSEYAAMEAEANAFAMELLMPFDWIVRDCQDVDVSDEKAVEKLSKKYRVAPTVMAMRIGEVRMLSQQPDLIARQALAALGEGE